MSCDCPCTWPRWGLVPAFCPVHHVGGGQAPKREPACEICDDKEILLPAAAWRRHLARCPKERG